MVGGVKDKFIDIIRELFQAMYDWFVGPFDDIHSLRDLIYGKDGTEKYIFHTFKENEILNVYGPGINITMSIAAALILTGIIIAGVRISSSGLNPSNRTVVLEFVKDLFIVGIVIANIGTFYALVFQLNGSIVDIFSATEDSLTEFSSTIKNQDRFQDAFLGYIAIQLILLGLALWANFYYMMRKMTLLIFMILGPLMVAAWMIPQFKGVTMAWMKEFIGTVFVQAIHALTFWLVASIAINQNNLVPSLILYVIFIPLAETIRSLFGLGGQMNTGLAKVGAAFGMASLAGLAGSIKGAMQDKTLTGSLKEAYQGTKGQSKNGSGDTDTEGKGVIGANVGTDTGTTSRAEKMLKSGEITSKAGKAVFGMAGTLAGSGLGPIGSIAGGTAGMMGGGAIGGVSGRAASATAMGIGNRFKKGVEGAKDEANKLNESAGMDDLAESMAKGETNDWISKNEKGLKEELKQRFPEFASSPEKMKELYNNEVSQKHQEHKRNALDTLKGIEGNDGKNANAATLAEESANGLTSAWASENKQKEMAKMTAENPGMQENEKIAKWNQTLGDKKQEYMQLANGTASDMSNGLDLRHSSINKSDYANQLANNVMGQEKTRFKLDNADLPEEEVNAKFEKTHGKQKQAYLTALNNAGDSVRGQSLMNKGHINSDHFASMMATNMTPKNRDGYVNQMKSEGFTEEEANKDWETRGKQRAYADNYKQVKDNLSNYAPGKVVIPSNLGGQLFKGAATVSGGALGFAKGATGINELSGFLADTKLGKLAASGVTGVAAGAVNARLDRNESIAQSPTLAGAGTEAVKGSIGIGASGATSGFNAMKESWGNEHIPQNLMGRQHAFKNGVAYSSGIIGGVSGYQKGAGFGMKHNPYNEAVQEQAAEVSEIAQMASTGSVQMVTTGNQSYIQARDKSGKTQIVSRYGSGDASLKQGEVVYQDLNVQDGAVVPKRIDGTKTSAYMVDSGGGKVPLNRDINVNPNRLISNRNVPVQKPVDIQPYNSQVESGQYFVDDVVENGQEQVRMVTERNRSYMVAQDNRGMEHRVSAYGKGNANLPEGQTVYTECRVSNKRIRPERAYTINAETQEHDDLEDYHNHIDPNELLPKKQNPRLDQRNERDQMRHFQGV